MAVMGRYCKAYYLERFRAYPGWTEAAESPDLTPESVLYLQDNYVVTDGIFIDENIVFSAVSDAWRDFCQKELGFEIPDYAKEAAAGAPAPAPE